MLLPLQGVLHRHYVPRALPWADCSLPILGDKHHEATPILTILSMIANPNIQWSRTANPAQPPPAQILLSKYSCQLCRICNPTPSNMSICDAEKVKTVFLGLQILILNGAGLQILLNSLLLKYSCSTPSCSNTPAQLTPAQRVNGCGQCREFQIRPPQFQTVRDKFRTKQSGTKKTQEGPPCGRSLPAICRLVLRSLRALMSLRS